MTSDTIRILQSASAAFPNFVRHKTSRGMLRTTAALLLFLFGCCENAAGQGKREFTLYVNSHMAKCQGEALMNCLVVRKDTLPATPWEWMHTHIEDFDYEPGYLYTLRVEEEDIPRHRVPADASSKRYRLIKLLDKSPDLRLRINDIWSLTHLQGKSADDLTGREQPYIEFHVAEMRYMGLDGCNRFQGKPKKLGTNTLTFDMTTFTENSCPDEQVSKPFRDLLSQVRTYEVENLQLVFRDSAGTELMKFKKTD